MTKVIERCGNCAARRIPAVQVRNCDFALAQGTGMQLGTRHCSATLIMEREVRPNGGRAQNSRAGRDCGDASVLGCGAFGPFTIPGLYRLRQGAIGIRARFGPFCDGGKVEWRDARAKARSYTFSVMRRAKEPYVIAYVTLAEGPTMMTKYRPGKFGDFDKGFFFVILPKKSRSGRSGLFLRGRTGKTGGPPPVGPKCFFPKKRGPGLFF